MKSFFTAVNVNNSVNLKSCSSGARQQFADRFDFGRGFQFRECI